MYASLKKDIDLFIKFIYRTQLFLLLNWWFEMVIIHFISLSRERMKLVSSVITLEDTKQALENLQHTSPVCWIASLPCNILCVCVCFRQAETRAEFAERTVAKLEKSIDDLEGMRSVPLTWHSFAPLIYIFLTQLDKGNVWLSLKDQPVIWT